MDEMIARAEGQVPTRPQVDAEAIPVWEEDGQKWTFHEFQVQAWEAKERFLFLVAGHQSGKSLFGAYWLLREIQRTATISDRNDYLIVGPDTELLKKSALPKFASLTRGMAEYKKQDRCFVFTPEGAKRLCGVACEIRVFVGYATKPESLEAATYKAIWPDECGQGDFLRESWSALQRRAGRFKARFCVTTTPYIIEGWFKEIIDDYVAKRRDDGIVINFPSMANPAYSREELDRLKKEYSTQEYELFVLGRFTRPAGSVFDCFTRERNVVEPFDIPDDWPRFLGMDFGQKNTAAVFLAEDPKDRTLYAYGSYHTGERTAKEHVWAIRKKALGSYNRREFDMSVGGTWSEDEWRTDFIVAGLPIVRPPTKDLFVGISRVYRQFKTGKLKVFSTCEPLIAEIESYRRDKDKNGETVEAIANKEKFHRLDALRYIVTMLRQSGTIADQRIQRVEARDVQVVGAYIDPDDEPEKVDSLRRIV